MDIWNWAVNERDAGKRAARTTLLVVSAVSFVAACVFLAVSLAL